MPGLGHLGPDCICRSHLSPMAICALQGLFQLAGLQSVTENDTLAEKRKMAVDAQESPVGRGWRRKMLMSPWSLRSVARSGPPRRGGFPVAGGTVRGLCHPHPADHGLLCHAPQGRVLQQRVTFQTAGGHCLPLHSRAVPWSLPCPPDALAMTLVEVKHFEMQKP